MRLADQQKVGRMHLYFHLCALLCITAAAASACFSQEVTVTGKIELFHDGIAQHQDSSDAVVWLTPLGDPGGERAPAGSPRLQLVQKNKNFLPHVLVVRVGVPVEFPNNCLLYTSPSPRDLSTSRMPSSA